MKDQVDGLKANGIEADFYNSSQEKHEQNAIFDKIVNKEIKLVICCARKFTVVGKYLK